MAASSPLIITTKILLPRESPDLLRRPRLIDFLHANIERKLILISAPAGYGKTSLLTDFAHDTELAVCWYSLDSFDRDPSVFLCHLIAAVQRAYPQFGSDVSAFLHSIADLKEDMYPLVATLVNEIYEKIPEYFVLILDDYHCLDDRDDINEFLAHFLRYMPENCHVILSTRTLPAIPNLSWLVATRQVIGLGMDELKFTAQEIRTLIKQNYDLDIPDEKAEQLAQYSEGWITPILLAAHTMWEKLPEDVAYIGDVHVYGYLAEQVFARQPPPIQDFLMASSALDEMSVELCGELPGVRDAAQMLDWVQRQNLFVTALGDEGGWLRYHHLFRDFLQSRLRRDPSRFTAVYSAAAQIYARRGEWGKAIERHLALEDHERVAELLGAVGRRFFKAGRLEGLDNWLRVLPEGILRAHPHLSLLWGRVRLARGDDTAAMELLRKSLQEFTQSGDRLHAGLAWVQMSTGSRLQGRYQETIRQSRQALELLREGGEEVRPDVAEAYKNLGISLYQLGDLPAGIAQLEAALAIYRELDDAFNVASVLHDLGVAHEAADRLDQALDCYERALIHWRALSNPAPWANTLNSIGVLHHLRGDYQRASEALEAALAKARESGVPRREAYALASLGDLRRDMGEYEDALTAYTKAMERVRHIHDRRLTIYLLDAIGNLHRLQRSFDEAEAPLREALERAEVMGSRGQIGACKTSLGILAYERGDVPQAIAILREAQELLSDLGFQRELARAHLHLGQALFLNGQADQGLEQVSRALALISPSSALQFLTAEAVRMEPLLEYTASREVETSLVIEALRRIRSEVGEPEPRRAPEGGLPPLRIYTLGQPQVFLGSEPITNWITSTTKELFFCLLDSAEGLSKERIGAILWPEHSPQKLNAIFRSTMYRLRRALFSEVVVFRQGIYAFNRQLDYWSDVEQFEELLARAGALPEAETEAKIALLSQAVELYRGDYLEEFFSDWCLVRRENLRVRYISALITLGDLHLKLGEYTTALQFYNRVLRSDPYQETAYRQAIRCYVMMGDRASAIRKYQECVAVLREGLGLDPMSETQALYQQLISQE